MMPGQSSREFGEPPRQVQFDGAVLRGIVRTVGQQLRPDLDTTTLDDRATKIADDLFNQLRQSWGEPGA
jgi:hypothetical protein